MFFSVGGIIPLMLLASISRVSNMVKFPISSEKGPGNLQATMLRRTIEASYIAVPIGCSGNVNMINGGVKSLKNHKVMVLKLWDGATKSAES